MTFVKRVSVRIARRVPRTLGRYCRNGKTIVTTDASVQGEGFPELNREPLVDVARTGVKVKDGIYMPASTAITHAIAVHMD